MRSSIYLNEVGVVCALGSDKTSVRAGLFADHPGGVAANVSIVPGKELFLGAVTQTLHGVDGLPHPLRSRNNALLLTALQQIRGAVDAAINRYGAHRVAVVVGTSTAGIGEAQVAMAHYEAERKFPSAFHFSQQEMGSPVMALNAELGLCGPVVGVSTACSSSAKALASAARLLNAGMADAVIAGGMDALSHFTVAGFSALEALSTARCNPLSRNRCGINIGEGGALFLMTREPSAVRLAGWGESSDAYHISAPSPKGTGAISAMRAALERARIGPEAIDYINLHGTATRQNDTVECMAVRDVFSSEVPVSSTKPLTGHTLGGAGALEAALCWLTLRDNPQGHLPPHWWDGEVDSELAPLHIVTSGETLGRAPQYLLSNSFAFGGSNASLVLAQG
ncbi:MAG: beta-ketoacyl-ACP synthase [Pseudomonadota bacterium]